MRIGVGAFQSFPEERRRPVWEHQVGLGELRPVGLGKPPVGVGQNYGNLIHTCPTGQTWVQSLNNGNGGCVLIAQVSTVIPTIVPPASSTQMQNAVAGDITVLPCHQVSMVVFPIPSRTNVHSDPKTVLEDLGFTVTAVLPDPSGGKLVYATLNSGTQYQSNGGDAMLLVYSGEGRGPFQSGEAITQGSTWGGVISWVNDDPASGSGSIGLSYEGGPGKFDPTSSIIGYTSNAYASSIFIYGAVLVSPKGNGKLGVTAFTDLGAVATSSGPCEPHNCPTGTFWNGNACVHLAPIKACPAGYSFSATQYMQTGNGCVPPPAPTPPYRVGPGFGPVKFGGGGTPSTGATGPTGGPVTTTKQTTTTTTTTTTQAPAAPSTGMSTGAIVAIGVVAVAAIGGLGYLMYEQKRKHAALPAVPAAPAPPTAPVTSERMASPFEPLTRNPRKRRRIHRRR